MSAETIGQPRAILVKVLSQLSEPDGTIMFENLPATTTIGELKQKIHDHVATKPAVEHQRLIYRGRVMTRETDTLMDVFGRDTVGISCVLDEAMLNFPQVNESDTYSLHLVIRDGQSPASSTPRAPISRTHSPLRHGSGGGPDSIRAALAQQQMRMQQHMHPGHAHFPPHIPVSNGAIHGPMPAGPNAFPPQTPMLHSPTQPQTSVVVSQGPFVPPTTMQGSVMPPPPLPPANNSQPVMPRLQDFNNLLQQHLAALQRYQAPQAQTTGPTQGDVSQPSPAGQPPNPVQAIQDFHQQLAQLQLQHQELHGQPAVAGTGASQPSGTVETPVPTQQAPTSSTLPNSGVQGPDGPPFGQHGFTRQSIAPNGDRMTISVQATTGPMPFLPFPNPFQNPPQHPVVVHNAGSLHPGFVRAATPLGPQNMLPGWSGSPPLGTFAGYYGTVHAIASMRRYEEDLSDLSIRIGQQQNQSSEPQDAVANGMLIQLYNLIRSRNRGQELINSILARNGSSNTESIPSTDVATLQSLNDRFQERARAVIQSVDLIRHGSNASNTDGSRLRPTPTTPHNVVTNDITAYLLISPAGPNAFVFTPQGTFSSPPNMAPGLLRVSSRSRSQHQAGPLPRVHELLEQARQDLANARGVVAAGPPQPEERPGADAAAGPAITDLIQVARPEDANAQPAAPAVVRPQAENGENDAFGMMGPLFQHTWLLVRLFGFIWFFTGGLGSSRTLMIAGAATIWFAIQAGLLGDRVDRIRRHFEGLLGPPNGPGGAQPAVGDVAAPPPTEPQRRNGDPLNPEDTAARLLRERLERDRGWVRQMLRTIEGAVALFIASLYPGVGERHVAAREEQRRQAEARAAEVLRANEETRSSSQEQLDEAEEASGADTAFEGALDKQEKAKVTEAAEGEAVDAGEGSSSSVTIDRNEARVRTTTDEAQA